MNTIAFEILPCLSSRDHEVRIRIDGEDWLGKDYLGIDPPAFFSQTALANGGELLVGRCNCGCEGCDDVLVKVLREEHQILWMNEIGLRLHFNREAYDKLIAFSRQDFSWEDVRRTAERLIADLLDGASLEDGFVFDWASARVREGMITLSFSKSGTQKLFEFSWDCKVPEQALAEANRFRKERISAEVQ